jgi:hypothetical protein
MLPRCCGIELSSVKSGRTCQGVSLQKSLHQIQSFLAEILKHVVSGIGEAIDFCRWKTAPPLGEKVFIKDKIPLTPDDLKGARLKKLGEIFTDKVDQIPRGIFRR